MSCGEIERSQGAPKCPCVRRSYTLNYRDQPSSKILPEFLTYKILNKTTYFYFKYLGCGMTCSEKNRLLKQLSISCKSEVLWTNKKD